MDSRYLTIIMGELFGSIKLDSRNPKYLFRYGSINIGQVSTLRSVSNSFKCSRLVRLFLTELVGFTLYLKLCFIHI